jgi:hypothetical protein
MQSTLAFTLQRFSQPRLVAELGIRHSVSVIPSTMS